MKHAHLEKDTNKLLGWYDDLIHDVIPIPNIKVEEEIWQEAININANCYENGVFIVKDFRTEEEMAEAELKRLEIENKTKKLEELKNILVTTSRHNTFNGDETARTNMMAAIQSSEILNQTTAEWKLADNTIQTVTINELKEALALSIQQVGEIVRKYI